MIKSRWGVSWAHLPSFYRDAWHTFPFETAEDAQELVYLATSRIHYLAINAPDETDSTTLKAWSDNLYEELVSSHPSQYVLKSIFQSMIMMFRGRCHLRNWELELPALLARIVSICAKKEK